MFFVATETTTNKVLARKATQAEVNAFAAEDAANRTALVGDKSGLPGANQVDETGQSYIYDAGSGEAFHDAPAATTAGTRAERRAEIYHQLAVNMVRLPAVFAKDAAEVTRFHALITKIVACAEVDANADNVTVLGHLKTAAGYDFLQYMIDWKKSAGNTASAWDAYLAEGGGSFDEFATPNASTGAPEAQSSVTVPSGETGWQTQEFETKIYPYLR